VSNRRSYQQFCGLARALDVIGERWTLLLVRDLLLGPKRYGDLLAGLPGLTTNLLAKRLRDLEQAALIKKIRTPPPASVIAYELTERGRELEPAVMALARWGGALMQSGPRDDSVNIAWGLTSSKRRYRGGEQGTVEFRLHDDPFRGGERCFQVRMSDDYLDVREGAPWASDVVVRAAVQTLQRLLFLGESAAALETAAELEIDGDRAVWDAYVSGLGLAV